MEKLTTPELIPSRNLPFGKAFEQLTDKEKQYAYYFSKASWSGLPIVMFQISHESPLIFVMFQRFFRSLMLKHKHKYSSVEQDIKDSAKLDEGTYNKFLNYVGEVYANTGNYQSFGHNKITPDLERSTFRRVLETAGDKSILELYDSVEEAIFNDSSDTKFIDLRENGGVNNLYLGGITKEEIEKVDSFLKEKKIDCYNSRLFKLSNSRYAYLVGSSDVKIVKHGVWNGIEIIGYYGDFNRFLEQLNSNLSRALKFSANDNQTKMIEKYIESFKLGSIEAHKDSQRFWIKDIDPIVETNIGWIESYLDPLGVRGYYEGFVALVDKENSKKFNDLVDNAHLVIENVPWDKDFEIYPFKKPNFTSIDIICFASNGCPLGINIPNYDDIREKEGFKNVSLGNNMPKFNPSKIKYLSEDDAQLLGKYGLRSYTVHVACHELLGHGTGKLLRKSNEYESGYNFKIDSLINPLTGLKVNEYYIDNEKFEDKFSEIVRSYEECRADVSGLFFQTYEVVRKIFSINPEEYDDILYTNWILYIRKGIIGTKLYNDKNGKWGQAHCQGAFVFTQFILRNQTEGKEILEIEISEDNFNLKFNKENLVSYGTELVKSLLMKLNVWKSCGSSKQAKEFYLEHSRLDDNMLKIREIVIRQMPPRELVINNNLVEDKDNSISVVEYEENIYGLVHSYLDRFDSKVEEDILEQSKRYNIGFFN